ncbi:MAG: hypothetical protein WAP52_00045, partial [Candidatus Sungiibacteriota bacterium]
MMRSAVPIRLLAKSERLDFLLFSAYNRRAMAWLSKIFGDANERSIRALNLLTVEIAAFEKEFANLS